MEACALVFGYIWILICVVCFTPIAIHAMFSRLREYLIDIRLSQVERQLEYKKKSERLEPLWIFGKRWHSWRPADHSKVESISKV